MQAKLKRPLNNPNPNPQNRHLMIATPCYGGVVHMPYVRGMELLTASLTAMRVPLSVRRFGGDSLITRARNRLVSEFLRSDATDLLFIDADIGFSPKDVQALTMGDFDVVAGVYPKKGYDWGAIHAAAQDGAPPDKLELCAARYPTNFSEYQNSGQSVQVIVKHGFQYLEVLDAPTGFMLIRREALEQFISQYRDEIAYVSDDQGEQAGKTCYMVFQAARDPDCDNPRGRYLSEDYWFCRKWQKMGGKIYLALDTRLTHTGSNLFRGDVSLLFEPDDAHPQTGEAPTRREEEAPAGA